MPPVVVPRKPQRSSWRIGTPAAGSRVVQASAVPPAVVRERGWQILQRVALAVSAYGLADAVVAWVLPDASPSATPAVARLAAVLDSGAGLAFLTLGLSIMMAGSLARAHRGLARLTALACLATALAIGFLAAQGWSAFAGVRADQIDGDPTAFLRTAIRAAATLLIQLPLLGWLALRGWRATRRR